MAQHLSIRVPWKDNGYSGLVCNKPCYNNACLRLKNVADSRDDELEEKLAGCPIAGHETEIPCLSEGGCFMSADTYSKTTVHPYKKGNSGAHGHFLETELVYPPFTLPARPFGWTMLRKGNDRDDANIAKLVERLGIDYDAAREPDLPFTTNWVQDATNQRAIFKTFYEDVQIGSSLVIPYAKQVPFIDDAKRVVMGIGVVTSLKEPPEHNHTDAGTLRSILWETMVGHSIREERKNGFLLPYREMMEYAEEHPDFDMNTITVLAEDDYFEEFSYATEQLSFDAVISVLLQTIKALEIIKECIPGNWNECITWTRNRLKEVWLDRGVFPGLGAMLNAVGFRRGKIIAKEVKAKITDLSDYESTLMQALKAPKNYFSSLVTSTLGSTEVHTFLSLSGERKALFWLLARMSLTNTQAEIAFNPEWRRKCGIGCSDKEIIENPYILYEQTRRSAPECIIPVKKVDMAVFPPEIIRNANPLQEPSALDSENDKRRIRAYAISQLEKQALWGHTVYPLDKIIEEVNALPIEPECRVTGDIMNSVAAFLQEELAPVECADGSKAYQLLRLYEIDEVIRSSIGKRLKGKRHDLQEDWRAIVDNAFEGQQSTEFEDRARTEKAAILKELAESRLSVLIGGAGTGKTTLLALLCKSPQIRDGGVLLLAPTGKARVRMSQAMKQQGVNSTAKTVAQFLSESKRFNGYTMEYHLSNEEAQNVPFTVIIDESSMLTEEMFGALLQALRKKAQRIIFVGDPNQLPPIGAGRPFVDLVRSLDVGITEFPKVGKGFGQLTVTMRQLSDDGQPRGDTELSKWYTGNAENLDDSIFIQLQSGTLGKHVAFKTWSTPEELEQKIFETVFEETEMTDIDDIEGFDISIGGSVNSGWMNFGSDPKKVESWQILSAYRNDAAIGTATINRYIHEKYRSQQMITLKDCKVRRTRHILGTDGIVFGDKVINVRNQKMKGYNVQTHATEDGYVANGEVGIVERIWEKPKAKKNTHQVVFSSQPTFDYNWTSTVSDEGNSDLELAYALTVHKAQGSEFGKAILVLGEPGGLLSKELLYTAITRQKDKLVILYNDGAYHLRDYSSMSCSEVARRFTCLFEAPNIVEYKKKYYEQALIHRTLKGDLVRSKSEVIIANMLFEAGIEYEYEKELDLGDDGIRIPDFTIEDAESGTCFYWEHCGMLGDAGYSKHWEEKKELYKKHDIVEGENLIVSKDSLNGGINSAEIKRLINNYLM
ncbi:MAG: AAA family ATPase [Lachnospiraceae bacterium]|nr:AAA family ATPase [Lachnospiraceae bacterium]